MLTKVIHSVACIVLTCLVPRYTEAQTRFETSDTVPNYAAYKYVDECFMAVVRLDYQADIKDSIWHDTLPEDTRVAQRPVAPTAIAHGRTCLAKVNIDTVSPNVEEFDLLGKVLLMVERDDDVERLILRMLDSAKNATEWNQVYNAAAILYSVARPIRTKGLQHLFQLSSPYETPKEAEERRVYTHVEIAAAALTLGDTVLPREVVSEVLQKLTTKAIEKKDSRGRSRFGTQLFALATDVLLDQAMDSLKVSTKAYRQFLEQLWSKMSDAPFFLSSAEKIGEKAPSISGKYWYQNGWSIDAGGHLRTSNQVTPIDAHGVPVPGKVNAILFLQGGCHSNASRNPNRFVRKEGAENCWVDGALAKRLKQQFPKLEVIVVSRTFGTFGGGLPMTVEDEAKTLSNYILGFFQIPAMQTVVETEFVRMPGLDRRRLDIPTESQEDYKNIAQGDVILVDEHGEIFHNVTLRPSFNRREITIQKKLQAVFSRTAQ